jgi:hypothetical protein
VKLSKSDLRYKLKTNLFSGGVEMIVAIRIDRINRIDYVVGSRSFHQPAVVGVILERTAKTIFV